MQGDGGNYESMERNSQVCLSASLLGSLRTDNEVDFSIAMFLLLKILTSC